MRLSTHRWARNGTAVIALLPSFLLVHAPPALADCTEAGGVTMCQNEIRGANPASEVWLPYPCEYDYLCDDGVSVFDYDGNDVDIDPPSPDNSLPRPDRGLPGTPGNRPDRPSGGGNIERR